MCSCPLRSIPNDKEWDSIRIWGRSNLHIDNIASLLSRPWPEHTFPVCDLVGLPRLLSLHSLPTKADFNPD